MDKLSPERLYISGYKDDLNVQKHIARYNFASMFIQNDYTLDCACGSGYGSNILSQHCDRILGIDKSQLAIEFAKENFKSDKIIFRQQNIEDLQFPIECFGNIISIETLEHIQKKDMVEFLKNAARWIKTGGCFIGSSPMLRYRDGAPYITNPYHINELDKEELIETIKECFPNFIVNFFYQDDTHFKLLDKEHEGFCVFVARKK